MQSASSEYSSGDSEGVDESGYRDHGHLGYGIHRDVEDCHEPQNDGQDLYIRQ